MVTLSNPGAEVDTAGWVQNGSTLIRNTTPANVYLGVGSFQVTPSGAAASPSMDQTTAGSVPGIVVGRRYKMTAWVKSNVGYPEASVAILWRDNVPATIGTLNGTTTVLPAGVWTKLVVEGNAIANTVSALLRVRETNTPPASAVFYVDAIEFEEVIPPEDDYVYVFDKGGSLFEMNTEVNVPFWDVERVRGLDLPNYDPSLDEIDGQDGGIVYAKYANIRTVIVDGTLYADPNSVDTEVVRVGGIMTPDNLSRRFWYKHPGLAARYLNVKAIDFKYDIETGRRIGIMPFEAQFAAEDPRIYRDETSLTLLDNVAQNATNNGTVPTWPLITISGDFVNAVITNVSTGASLTITYDTVGSQTVVVDMLKRTIRINSVLNSNVKTAGNFWALGVGINSVKVDVTTGSPTMTFQYASGWMV